MANITVDRFKELKARIDAELLRRKYVYAVSNVKVPYTTEPAVGKKVEIEHYQKINDPINLINSSYGEASKKPGSPIEDLDVLDANLAILESTGVNHSTGNCSGNCTGLCAGACSTNCSGSCGNNCSGGCGGSCSGGCKGCLGNCQS